jgi:hypothetical protein
MPNDHFVARTYLKLWCDRDKGEPIQAYWKPSGATFSVLAGSRVRRS